MTTTPQRGPLGLRNLRTYYRDPKIGLVGKKAFIRNLYDNDIKFNETDVDTLFASEGGIVLNKPIVRDFERRPVVVTQIDEIWGADLAFLPQFEEENDGYSAMLFVIDFFSKYLWVELVKNKKSATITEAFKRIFSKTKRRPKHLNVDAGGEFKGETLKFLKEMDVDVYLSKNETKVPMVERVQRTIKQRIGRLLDNTGDYRYVDILPDIVKSYNSTFHSTIKMTPTQASKKENEKEVRENIYRFIQRTHKIKQCNPIFHGGDYVKISVNKKLFAKEIEHKWSKENFKIKEVLTTIPCTYRIEDLAGEEIEGTFYTQELQKVEVDDDVQEIEILDRRVVRGQKQVRVKYPDGSKRWILDEDLQTI